VPAARIHPAGVDVDEHPRPETTAASLAALRPVFRKDGGTVTAGNAFGESTTGRRRCCWHRPRGCGGLGGRAPLARFVAPRRWPACPPKHMGLGPIPATERALARAGIGPADLDLIELNEAFAAQGRSLRQRTWASIRTA